MQENVDVDFSNFSIDNLKQVMVRIYKGTSQQEVNEATVFLIAYSQTIASVPVFVQLLTQESVAELRLLSAIILKKSIGIHLETIVGEDRSILRRTILSQFFDEPQRRGKRAIAMLAAVILKICAEGNDLWSEPMVVVAEKTKPDQPEDVRLQGFLLLNTILEIAGKDLTDFYKDLFQFFLQTIRDDSATIRKQTLLCVLNMYNSVSDDDLMTAFNEIYPFLMENLYQSLQENDEDTIEKALEVLYALTERKGDLFTHEQLTKLIEVFCTEQALLSKNLNLLFRENMIDILINITSNYKAVISKNEATLRKILEVTFKLACTKEQDADSNQDTIQDAALTYVREAGNLLPKKKSYPIYKEYLMQMFESQDTNVVCGAFMILGNLSEGCCEYIRRELPTLLKSFVQKALDSPNDDIKEAALYAIFYFSEFCVPEIIAFHEMILPPLIKNLNTSNQKFLEGNVSCLVVFCEEMSEEIINFIPEILPKLMQLIDQPQNTSFVKRSALLSIASCARVAKEKFAEYAAELIPLLAQLVNLTDPQYADLKATSAKTIGVLIASCIKDNPQLFENHVQPLIETIYLNLKDTDNTYLKECCLEFFYNLASYLGENFKPYLNKLVEIVFNTIENVQNLKTDKPKVISLNPDHQDEPDVADQNLIEEVTAAICCLGEMAKACPADFYPFYEKTVPFLDFFSTYYERILREQALKCYGNLTIALTKLGNNGVLPKFEKGLPCAQRLPDDAEKFLYGECYEKLLTTLEMDDEIETLITVLEILFEFCTELGPAAVDQRLERITEQLLKIFQNDTNAQNQAFEGEDEVHGELFGAATLLVITLTKTCREGYFAYFDKLYQELKKFVNEDTQEDDVAEIFACFTQAIRYIPSAVGVYGLEILDVCVKGLEFGDEYINQNIAFCMGEIVEHGKDLIYPHYKTIMEKLRVIYDNSMLNHTRDNAIAAIGRMVFTNPELVPLDMIVPAVLKEMPLQGDPKENRTLIKMVIFLFETNQDPLKGFEEKCIGLLVDAIANRKKYKIKDENVLRAIGSILKNLSGNREAKEIIEKAAADLSQENISALQELMG